MHQGKQSWQIDVDGPLSTESMMTKFGALGYDCQTYTYPPGTVFPLHTHSQDKLDGVLQGQFKITMNDNTIILGPGDYIAVPAGVEHSAEVMGIESVISIDGIAR